MPAAAARRALATALVSVLLLLLLRRVAGPARDTELCPLPRLRPPRPAAWLTA